MAQTITIKEIYDELKKIEKKMATKKDIESIKETLEILSNPETMKQIVESVEDIKSGRVKEVNTAKDILTEL